MTSNFCTDIWLWAAMWILITEAEVSSSARVLNSKVFLLCPMEHVLKKNLLINNLGCWNCPLAPNILVSKPVKSLCWQGWLTLLTLYYACYLFHLSIQPSKHYCNVKNMIQKHGSPSDIFLEVLVRTAYFFLKYAIASIKKK